MNRRFFRRVTRETHDRDASQIGGNREAAFVIQAGAGDDGSVNFRLEKRQLHRQSNWAGNPTAG